MKIQEEIREGVAYQVAQAQGSLGEGESIYSLPPCEFASAMQNADCILKYLDSQGVRIEFEQELIVGGSSYGKSIYCERLIDD